MVGAGLGTGQTSREGGPSLKRVVLVGLSLTLVVLGLGARKLWAPRSFRDMLHPAPIVRARAPSGWTTSSPSGWPFPP